MIKHNVTVQVSRNWTSCDLDGDSVWMVGTPFCGSHAVEPTEILNGLFGADSIRFLSTLNGSFAVIVRKGGRYRIATDIIAAHKVLIKADDKGTVIFSNAQDLGTYDYPQMDPADRALFMASGVTLGARSLYPKISILEPASFAELEAGKVSFKKYFNYLPTKIREGTKQELKEVLWDIFERMNDAIGDRPVLVPLSGGFDSRLIVSALHELGRKNVQCFSYGPRDGFEARTAEAVAEKLGYPWKFIPLTRTGQRKLAQSSVHQEYLSFADTLSATPFEQDFLAIQKMVSGGQISDETVLINGQSGDFLSGGHLPAVTLEEKIISPSDVYDVAIKALIKKHFNLWMNRSDAMSDAESSPILKAYLENEFQKAMASYSVSQVYEYFEYNNRQSKYVISGQRVYDFFDIDWFLPLWDVELVKYFSNLPVSQKFCQKLYIDTLLDMNLGKVWKDIPVNKKTVRPLCLIPFRALTKLASVPFGPDAWRKMDAKYFMYFSEPLGLPGMFSYRDFALTEGYPRNIVSLLTKAYVERREAESGS